MHCGRGLAARRALCCRHSDTVGAGDVGGGVAADLPDNGARADPNSAVHHPDPALRDWSAVMAGGEALRFWGRAQEW